MKGAGHVDGSINHFAFLNPREKVDQKRNPLPLIKKVKSVWEKNEKIRTRANKKFALHSAVMSKDEPSVKRLLDLGVSVLVADSSGKTPIDYAVEKQLPAIENLLLRQKKIEEKALLKSLRSQVNNKGVVARLRTLLIDCLDLQPLAERKHLCYNDLCELRRRLHRQDIFEGISESLGYTCRDYDLKLKHYTTHSFRTHVNFPAIWKAIQTRVRFLIEVDSDGLYLEDKINNLQSILRLCYDFKLIKTTALIDRRGYDAEMASRSICQALLMGDARDWDFCSTKSPWNSISRKSLNANFYEKTLFELICIYIFEFDLVDKLPSYLDSNIVSPDKLKSLQVLGYFIKQGKAEAVSFLLNYHEELPNERGWRLLHKACKHLHVSILALLVVAGADPNQTDGEWKTPLHLLAKLDLNNMSGERDEKRIAAQQECFEILLRHGASLQLRDNDDKLAFQTAIVHKNYEIAGLFLQHGFDPNSRIEQRDYLSSKMERISLLEWALRNEKHTLVKLLLAYKVDVRGKDKSNSFLIAQRCAEMAIDIGSDTFAAFLDNCPKETLQEIFSDCFSNPRKYVKLLHAPIELEKMLNTVYTPEEARKRLVYLYANIDIYRYDHFEDWLKKADWKEYMTGFLVSKAPGKKPNESVFNQKIESRLCDQLNNSELCLLESLYFAPYITWEKLHEAILTAEEGSFVLRAILWEEKPYTIAKLHEESRANPALKHVISWLALLSAYSPDKVIKAISEWSGYHHQGKISAKKIAAVYLSLTTDTNRIDFFKQLGESHETSSIAGLVNRNELLQLCTEVAVEAGEEVFAVCLRYFPKDLLWVVIVTPFTKQNRLLQFPSRLQSLFEVVFPREEARQKYVRLYMQFGNIPFTVWLDQPDWKELLICVLDHVYPRNDPYQFPLSEENQFALRKLLNTSSLGVMESFYFASCLPHEKLQEAVDIAGARSFVHRQFFIEGEPWTLAKLVERSQKNPVLCQKISWLAMLYSCHPDKMIKLAQEHLDGKSVSLETIRMYLALCRKEYRMEVFSRLKLLMPVCEEWIGVSFQQKLARLQNTPFSGLAALRSTGKKSLAMLESRINSWDSLCFPRLSRYMQESLNLPEIGKNLKLYMETLENVYQTFISMPVLHPKEQYKCPISREYIIEPVRDGGFSRQLYDKKYIENWLLQENKAHWPVSGEPIHHIEVDLDCKRKIFAWRLQRIHQKMSVLRNCVLDRPDSAQKTDWQQSYAELENEKVALAEMYGFQNLSDLVEPSILPAGARLYSCASAQSILSILRNGIKPQQKGRFGRAEFGWGLYLSLDEAAYYKEGDHVLVLEVMDNFAGGLVDPLSVFIKQFPAQKDVLEQYNRLDYPYLRHAGLPPRESEVVLRQTNKNIRVLGVMDGVQNSKNYTPIEHYAKKYQLQLDDTWTIDNQIFTRNDRI